MRARRGFFWVGVVSATGLLASPVATYGQQTATRSPQAASSDVDRFLASCMLAKNKAEIELSKLAVEKSQNEQVQQFAKTLIEDHSKAVQQLQPLAGMAANSANQSGRGQSATSAGAIDELVQIDRAIVEEVTKRTKQQLQQKSGAEFNKAFLGLQIGCHTEALAALSVIENQTSGELAQLAQDLQPTIEDHLSRAKELMQQVEPTSEQARRTEPARRSR